MSILKPFKAIRPAKEKAKTVASRPYDVLDAKEARLEAKGNPHSFLHVIKPEIHFPDDFDHYAPEIYKKGKDNFDSMMQEGVFFREEKECFYVYRLIMNGHPQTGIVGCSSIDEYFDNTIKKHELTRPDKEEDRKNHIRAQRMNAEPVFFSYPHVDEIDALVEEIVKTQPEYDFSSEDGIRHTLWAVSDIGTIDKISALFDRKVPSVYVADGHHRTAAGALVGKEIRDSDPASSPDKRYNYFMSVLFPDNQLKILDYNRVIKDLNGLSKDDFIRKVKEHFTVAEKGSTPYRPEKLHLMGMYLEDKWYSLTANTGTYDDNDPIGVLDVTILSRYILEPILGIKDLRTDKRIDFVGGIRGLGELERRVNSGEMKVAFAMYPVSMKQLIDISDNGLIMPPKVTWFEPKLRSGLFIHSISG